MQAHYQNPFAPPIRMNADTRLRDIERRLQSGELSPELALAYYTEQLRNGIDPLGEAAAKPEIMVQTKHGMLRIYVQDAGGLHLENRWKENYRDVSDPWTFNRVPFTFSQNAQLKGGRWVVKISSYGIYRVGGGNVSASVEKKLQAALEEEVNKWAATQPAELAQGDVAEHRRAIESLQKEMADLQRQLADKEHRIGAHYMRVLAARSGQALAPRPHPQTLAGKMSSRGDLEGEAARLLGVDRWTLRSWGQRGGMTHAQEEAVISVARQLGVAENPGRLRRRRRR